MTQLALNTTTTRGLLYGLITLCSLVVFGSISEICDYENTCPARLVVVIIIGVLCAVIAGVTLIATVLKVQGILKMEIVFAGALLVLYSVCVGIVSSIRTGIGNSIAVSFAWFGEVLSFIVVFATAMSSGRFCTGTGKASTRRECALPDEEVPEGEYMKQVGVVTGEEEDAGGQECMVPLEPVDEEAGGASAPAAAS